MLTIYGLKISYFTGKMEAYLRYKEIPFRFQAITMTEFEKTFPKQLGAQQIPVLQLEDGRLMTDTTPMIDWLEADDKNTPILPSHPAMAFFARLIEDYADEYLWRPAMHYRWSYWESANLLRRQIVDEATDDIKLPKWMKNRMIYRRQLNTFVRGDGVTKANWHHVENAYLGGMKILDPIFKKRPFLFGERPCLADIGLMGPYLRHFSMDPMPAKIMRETAPHVMEWIMRVWNARASQMTPTLPDSLPEDVWPLIEEIGKTHLPALNANAEAMKAKQKTHSVTLEGYPYEKLPTSEYRLWCLSELHRHYHALASQNKRSVDQVLQATGAKAAFLQLDGIGSDYNASGTAPFGSQSKSVFGHFNG
jgi:glutathione S-transferase